MGRRVGDSGPPLPLKEGYTAFIGRQEDNNGWSTLRLADVRARARQPYEWRDYGTGSRPRRRNTTAEADLRREKKNDDKKNGKLCASLLFATSDT